MPEISERLEVLRCDYESKDQKPFTEGECVRLKVLDVVPSLLHPSNDVYRALQYAMQRKYVRAHSAPFCWSVKYAFNGL